MEEQKDASRGVAPRGNGGGDAPVDEADPGDVERFDILQDGEAPETVDALKDLVMLAGVLRDMASERFWSEPRYVFDTLRTFELIRRSTFYEEEAVQGEDELAYRFQRAYGEKPSIDIPRLVRLGRRNNWITTAANPPLKFTTPGRRMVGQLFRIANDSLFYYRRSPALRDIYQAERDLQLARAYEDMGIGVHDTVASVMHNLENAVNDLRYMREKYVQDRRAVERYEAVIALVQMLERELEARMPPPGEIVDRRGEEQRRRSSLLFYRVLQELSALLGENAYTSQVQVGRAVLRVDCDRWRQYLVDAFGGELRGMALGPLRILQYLNEGAFGEELAGDAGSLWLPFHLPPLLHEQDVTAGAACLQDWIDRWEAPAARDDVPPPVYDEARRVTAAELAEIVGASTSIARELSVDTKPLVEAIARHPGRSVAALINDLGENWSDALRWLSAMAYLITEAEAFTFEHAPSDAGEAAREYRWKVGYPEGGVRYVKGTAKLGKHLEGGTK
ncbi:MAG: hypothetical protein QME76_03750 [Bacillota bacterium]|nr:hypothetical protein [Bacillota bacterium]